MCLSIFFYDNGTWPKNVLLVKDVSIFNNETWSDIHSSNKHKITIL